MLVAIGIGASAEVVADPKVRVIEREAGGRDDMVAEDAAITALDGDFVAALHFIEAIKGRMTGGAAVSADKSDAAFIRTGGAIKPAGDIDTIRDGDLGATVSLGGAESNQLHAGYVDSGEAEAAEGIGFGIFAVIDDLLFGDRLGGNFGFEDGGVEFETGVQATFVDDDTSKKGTECDSDDADSAKLDGGGEIDGFAGL